ncbi:MAG: energy-coupling factor ABC transporter ATP-binding protein [Candidatus Saccharicenans sp.]
MNRLALEINQLSYSYSDGTLAIKNISFSVIEGEKLMIIGPNGAGKSTLLLHLNGLLRGKGEIKIYGEPVIKKNLKKIRTRVGLVFQNPDDQLFMPSVLDDVAFGLFYRLTAREEIEVKVRKILKDLGIEHLAGKSQPELSLGEKKKVSLATVLVLEPEILVLDEPTSGLDPGSRRWLINYLKKTSRTLVVATHDLNFAWEIGQRMIIMDRGEIIAIGRREEILGNKDLLEQHNLEIPLLYLLEKIGVRS